MKKSKLVNLIEECYRLRVEIEREAKLKYPPGTRVYFKRGAMSDYQEAEIDMVSEYSGYPRLRIRNLYTGRQYWIGHSSLRPEDQ